MGSAMMSAEASSGLVRFSRVATIHRSSHGPVEEGTAGVVGCSGACEQVGPEQGKGSKGGNCEESSGPTPSRLGRRDEDSS